MTEIENNRKIGLIGTGLMGAPIAMRLAQEGFSVSVFNRTTQKAERLIGGKVTLADGVAELLADCSVILLVLSDAMAIRAVVMDGDKTLSGCTFIQMGTISPEESRALAAEFASQGASYLEAPVLGSIPEAKEGKLIVMVGGSKTQFFDHYSIFDALGAEISLIGDVGAASALKLAMNQLIGSLTAAFSVSLGFIQASNVPVETFMSIVRTSALYAKTYDKKLQRMLDRDFSNPNFPTKHLLKDMQLIEMSAAQNGVTTETLHGIIKVLQSAIDMGLADTDYSAVFQAIYKLDA